MVFSRVASRSLQRVSINPIVQQQRRFAVPLIVQRFNSTLNNDLSAKNTENNNQVAPLSQSVEQKAEDYDEDLDEWLTAIDQLRSEFTNPSTPYNPETSLAPPDKSKIDLATLPYNKFKPTEEQLQELRNLKNKAIPLPKDEVLENCTNLIMRHGKKARAEKLLARALYLVKLQLRDDPVKVLKDILERMSPLMTVKTFRNGTAKSSIVPIPLNQRQRIRFSFGWILDSASKRPNVNFSVRLGEELVAAAKGDSVGYDKRAQMHKDAMSYRAYIKL